MSLMARPRPRLKRSDEHEQRPSSGAPPELERQSLLLKDGRYLIAYRYVPRNRDA